LTLTDHERTEFEALARSRRGRADESLRARIVLLLADGCSYSAICERSDCTPQTIATWKARFQAHGVRAGRNRAC
jgi:transposase